MLDRQPEFPPPQRPTWRLVTEEVLSMAATGLLVPFGMHHDKRRTPRAREQRTVVLIHGYMANRSTLLPLKAYLRWRGYDQVLTFNYKSGLGVEAAARSLHAHLKAHVRGGRIDLVGHSLGGLVARVYVQELGGARRVDRCITLGTPHHGTYNSYWVPTRVGREMRPDSPLITRLKQTSEAAGAVRFVSIVGGADNLVLPRTFAGYEEVVQVPEVGHVGMLLSPRVLSFVADCLDETDAAAVSETASA
jgi:triacylglycerol lipase